MGRFYSFFPVNGEFNLIYVSRLNVITWFLLWFSLLGNSVAGKRHDVTDTFYMCLRYPTIALAAAAPLFYRRYFLCDG